MKHIVRTGQDNNGLRERKNEQKKYDVAVGRGLGWEASPGRWLVNGRFDVLAHDPRAVGPLALAEREGSGEEKTLPKTPTSLYLAGRYFTS